MKLLLTSAGITNPSIAKALFDLVDKAPEETNIVFIPTASNIEHGDKGWVIDDLVQLQKLNFKQIEIADISALPESIWKPRFEEADILFFEGGNMFHLMEWMNTSGLTKLLPELLKSKVYVGVSAGSMVTNPSLLLPVSQVVYEEDFDKTTDMPSLHFVDFYFLPHLNSEYFFKVRKGIVEQVATDISKKVYALDDQSALKIVDGNIEVVSEGQYVEFN